MSLHPVLVDSRPAYLGRAGSSLLLVPIGAATLLSHLLARLSEVTAYRPVVVPPESPAADYAEQVAAVSPGLRILEGPAAVSDLLGTLEPSDTLLVVDPRSFPLEGFDPRVLVSDAPLDPRWVTHLVTLGTSGGGTREYADIDGQGRVRRVRRYYETVTWPFIDGVIASLLPVSSVLGEKLAEGPLAQLRCRLAARGVPSRDVPLPGNAVDLSHEAGLLALVEKHVRRTAQSLGRPGPLYVGSGQQVHPTARIVGPVVLHADVVVEERALVMGPAVLCAGARVGRAAIVAQSVVGSGCLVPPGQRVHHRALAEATSAGPAGATKATEPRRWLPEPGDDADSPLPRTRYMSVKRIIETSVAVALLLALLPLMVVIAVLIALDSKGPIFYGHEREGLRGRRFRCLKFRSMQVGAQALERELHAQSLVDGPQFKLKRDPRVTRVGRLLRLTNLDELPQLINVVRGEMALVGPRPSPFNENQLCVPWRQGRLSVRPGITGLWQVCRHDRSEGDFHQWIEYDLLYVRHMSPGLDLRILMATFLSMGGQRSVPSTWILPALRPLAPRHSVA